MAAQRIGGPLQALPQRALLLPVQIVVAIRVDTHVFSAGHCFALTPSCDAAIMVRHRLNKAGLVLGFDIGIAPQKMQGLSTAPQPLTEE